MNENRHTQLIKDLYACFSRGDVHTNLNALTEDVEWLVPGSPAIPYAGTNRGTHEVAKFYEILAAGSEVLQFEPGHSVASGDTVVALGYYRGRASTTGRIHESDWAMSFTFRNGRVRAFTNISIPRPWPLPNRSEHWREMGTAAARTTKCAGNIDRGISNGRLNGPR